MSNAQRLVTFLLPLVTGLASLACEGPSPDDDLAFEPEDEWRAGEPSPSESSAPDAHFLGFTCSSEYAPGWCDQLGDGVFGTCNVGEWATASQATGWVELRWDQPVVVEGLSLHDRACPEHVLHGHVSFDDGSEHVAFGPLEDSGTQALELSFDPRMVTSLRVHIDAAWVGHQNPNPGLGEIIVDYGPTLSPCASCGGYAELLDEAG